MRGHRRVFAGTAMVAMVAVVAVTVIALPAGGVTTGRERAASKRFGHLSQIIGLRYWSAHPDNAPPTLQARLQRMRALATSNSRRARGARARARAAQASDAFNLDATGLPQNEESVTACGPDARTVLMGTNDFRFIIDPQGNATGWHLSTDGGASVANEGLLPPVKVRGTSQPSGGDPVEFSDAACQLYAGDLNYDPVDPNHHVNGVGLYRSNTATLAACPGGPDPACWPVRQAVATAAPPHFLDKPWFALGPDGHGGQVVWAVFADFINDDAAPLGFTSASIKAVRCRADLSHCSSPILISGGDTDVQSADVTVAPDGRTYISWMQIQGELEGTPQTYIHKLRVAPPGKDRFGPTRVIATERLPISQAGVLHANDFRVATFLHSEVVTVNGRQRVFAVWEACAARVGDGAVCEEPQIKLTYSDDQGATWSAPTVLSRDGDNYFVAISTDGSGRLVVAYYTHRFDPAFHSRQDVELVTVDPATGAAVDRKRVTSVSNDTQADPTLGGLFIGDYIDVHLTANSALIGYNANTRFVPLLGEGVPVPQQDNFLARVLLP